MKRARNVPKTVWRFVCPQCGADVGNVYDANYPYRTMKMAVAAPCYMDTNLPYSLCHGEWPLLVSYRATSARTAPVPKTP